MKRRLTIACLVLGFGGASGAVADERSLTNAMAECFFVVLSGQPVDRRFPDATPVAGEEGSVQEVRGDTTVTVAAAKETCWVTDTTVSPERAGEMVGDIARRGRITNLEETTVGRSEPAIRGTFNQTPVLISWYRGQQGGVQYTVRVNPL